MTAVESNSSKFPGDIPIECTLGKMPILIFNFKKDGNIQRAVAGEKVGTLISSEGPKVG